MHSVNRRDYGQWRRLGVFEWNVQKYPLDATERIDAEVSRLAVLCGIALLRPGVVEAILGNDASICLVRHGRAWSRLRELLVWHYDVPGVTIEVDGGQPSGEPSRQQAERVRVRIQPRYLARPTGTMRAHPAAQTTAPAIQ